MSRGFINNNLLDLLEELRLRMHMDMSEALGIPRLDPFFMDELNLEPILNELVACKCVSFTSYVSNRKNVFEQCRIAHE